MTACRLLEPGDVELYFYDDLPAADLARVASHVKGCADCRRRLEELHAIRSALSTVPSIDAPPAADWSGFMRRLDQAIGKSGDRRESAQTSGERVPRVHPAPAGSALDSPARARTFLALAATLALVAGGVFIAARFKPVPSATGVRQVARDAAVRPGDLDAAVAGQPVGAEPVAAERLALGALATPAVSAEKGDVGRDRALREGSAEHLERSKLVILGLATRDPHARAEDWQYERTLAASLLSETRLYRQAALQDGMADVERVMRDLETVLLEASMSDARDRAALERVQRLIARRDLVLKIQVVAASGASGD